jgi:hypothetical protein
MSAYRDALRLWPDAPASRVALAAELLNRSEAVVLIGDSLVLRPVGNALECEVIDRAPLRKREEAQYAAMVQAAKEMLVASPIYPMLSKIPIKWVVVDDYGMGTARLWDAI